MDWLLDEKTWGGALFLALVAFAWFMIRGWARSWQTREIAQDDRLNDHSEDLSEIKKTQAVHSEKHERHERDIEHLNERIDRSKSGGQ